MRPIGSKKELEQRRRLGVALHRTGLTIREVAKQLGCAPGSVARWTKLFIDGGDAGLNPIPNAGSKSRLTEAQRARLAVLIRDGAQANGFATELWTLRRVRELIEREFGVQYSITNTHLILHRLGFSPQKAIRRAREQDAEAVAYFRTTTWREVKKKRVAKDERSR